MSHPWHVLLRQKVPGAQTNPHPPQLLESDVVSTHVLPHRVRPEGHWHWLFTQVVPAGQVWPQAPQLFESLVRSVSHPSAVRPLQLPKPAAQVAPQTPLLQTGVIFGGAGQA
jgi:hypothetical protein